MEPCVAPRGRSTGSVRGHSTGPEAMHYVYILTSLPRPDQTYIGSTRDLAGRLRHHNEGASVHTAKFRPWRLAWYCAFPDKYRALEFEKYLKSHSGKAFRNKRLI